MLVTMNSGYYLQNVEEPTRNIYIISDLHMGLGKLQDGGSEWHPTEDFRWPNALNQDKYPPLPHRIYYLYAHHPVILQN